MVNFSEDNVIKLLRDFLSDNIYLFEESNTLSLSFSVDYDFSKWERCNLKEAINKIPLNEFYLNETINLQKSIDRLANRWTYNLFKEYVKLGNWQYLYSKPIYDNSTYENLTSLTFKHCSPRN